MAVRIQDLVAVADFSAVVNMTDLICIGDDGAGNDMKMTLTNFVEAVEDATKALARELTNKEIDSDNNTITNIVNADIKAAAAIAINKLAAFANKDRVIVSNAGTGFMEESTVTAAQLEFLKVVAGTVTASKALVVDASKELDELTIDDFNIKNGLLSFTGTPEEIDDSGGTGPHAASLVKEISEIITGVGNTVITLGGGTAGQTKIITFKTDGGGNVIVTPSAMADPGSAVVTLSDEGDTVIFIFLNAKWSLLGTDGGVKS
jgi:hypothetical protein